MKLAISSPSFCKNKVLVKEISDLKNIKTIKFNLEGLKLAGENLISFLEDCDVWLVGTELVNEEVLTACPNIKLISKYGVGLDNIDFELCEKMGVKINYAQGVNAQSVAELALGNILSLTHNSYINSHLLKQGIWEKSGGVQLFNKTIGIIGVGHVGKKLIKLLQPFECKFLVNDVLDNTQEQQDFYKTIGAESCELNNLLAESDIVSIHAPLNNLTRNLIAEPELKLMKKSSFLINTARGLIINQQDLKKHLKNNLIAGAAVDVYESEPCEDLEFLSLPNLLCTPHIAGNTLEAVEAMGRAAIDGLEIREREKIKNGINKKY